MIRCGCCDGPLSHVDEACPTCLPNFYARQRMTASEAIDAIFAARRRRLPADAFIPADPRNREHE